MSEDEGANPLVGKLLGQDTVVETQNYFQQPEAAPFVKQERERTDEYLLLPDCDTASVKQRQGKLEVKALDAGPRLYRCQGGRWLSNYSTAWSCAQAG